MKSHREAALPAMNMIYQIHQRDAEMRGEERGIAIGEERGEQKEKIKTANRMLSRKMPLDVISELTGLPISEINKLKTAPNAN